MANLVVLIEQVGGDLEMSLADTTQANLQKTRRGETSADPRGEGRPRKGFIKTQRQRRSQPWKIEPEFIGPHVPIILLRGDTVTFKSVGNTPFLVDVEYDDGYLEPGTSVPPRSPLRDPGSANHWPTPQNSKPDGAGSQIVVGEFDGDNGFHKAATDFMFYKCTVWSNGIKLDPDFICDR